MRENRSIAMDVFLQFCIFNLAFLAAYLIYQWVFSWALRLWLAALVVGVCYYLMDDLGELIALKYYAKEHGYTDLETAKSIMLEDMTWKKF